MTTDRPSPIVVPLKGRKCPVCGKRADHKLRPFCSKRCADLDLAKWFDGDYRMPTDEMPGDADFGADEDEQSP